MRTSQTNLLPTRLAVFLATCLGLHGVAVAAESSTNVQYGTGGLVAVGLVNVPNPPAPISLTFQNGEAFASIYASAAVGRLGASANAHVPHYSASPLDTRVSALARPSWTDELTFNSLGLTGQPGSATLSLAYSWTLALTDPSPAGIYPAQSYAQGDVKMTATYGNRGSYAEIGDALVPTDCGAALCPIERVANFVGSGGPPTPVQPGPGILSLEVAFIFGDPFSLTVYLSAQTSVYGGQSSSTDATVDASHTALWGGINAVLSEGTSVDYSVSSASGFNYRVPLPVPEPGTYALMLSGLGVLGLMARRRRSAQPVL